MDLTPYLPYAIPATIVSLAIVAKVAGDLSAQAEGKQASRVQRIEAAVSRVAGCIAVDLLANGNPATTPANALNAIKSAAIAQGADYLLGALPDTIAKAGATKGSVIAMLTGEVSKQQMAVMGPAVLAAIGGTSLATSGAPANQPAAAA